jgi:CelD/BcsL family acetyltransferase involved in cellulose biosynthesis
MAILLETIDTLEGFLALEQDWNALAEKLGTPLLRHELFAAIIKAREGRSRLAILVLRDGDAVRAIAPLHLKRRLGARRLEFISYELHEPSGLLYAGEVSLQTLIRGILESRLPVYLNKLSAGGAEVRCIQELGRGKWLAYTDAGSTLRVPLSADFSAVEKGVSARRRKNFRHFRKRAERSGEVEFVAVAPDVLDVNRYLDEVLRVEASGWKGRRGTAILSNPETERFFRLYGRATAERRMARVFLMKISGVTVAARFAVAHAGRLWELKIGYDERFRSCSPGILLTHETLRHASREGLVAHEFLGVSEEWQRIWTCEEQQYQTVRHYPVSIASIACLGADSARLVQLRAGRIFSLSLERLTRLGQPQAGAKA